MTDQQCRGHGAFTRMTDDGRRICSDCGKEAPERCDNPRCVKDTDHGGHCRDAEGRQDPLMPEPPAEPRAVASGEYLSVPGKVIIPAAATTSIAAIIRKEIASCIPKEIGRGAAMRADRGEPKGVDPREGNPSGGALASQDELEPCPFCGGEVGMSLNFRNGRQLWYVVCETVDCFVSMEHCDANRLTESWNRRKKGECRVSYSFQFSGDADAVAKKFDEERDKCAGRGMIGPELRDIDEARAFAVQIASEHGNVTGSCGGHWFGRISITIDAGPAAEPATKEGE